jgi:glycosyltransferase involved in cell wall biosynthesis
VCLNGIGSRQKGAEVLIEAVETLNRGGLADRFTLDLYGYSAAWAVERLDGVANVGIHAGYEPSEIERLLDGYHVGIVPSVWEEPYAYVGPELLAKGIPVIGNARGGIVDYTTDGATGWVNRSANADGLAEIMRTIIDDPQQVLVRNRWILDHRAELIRPLDRHLGELDDLYGEVIAAAAERRRGLERQAGPSL